MPDIETRYFKSRSGWEGETIVPLPFSIEGKPAQLRLSTRKNGGPAGLVTYAGVQTRDGAFVTTRVFRDYHQRCRFLQGTRCTEKSVREEHAFWLTHLNEGHGLVERAIQHHRELGDAA